MIDDVASEGFAFVEANAMRALLQPFGALNDWTAFADSWNRLSVDPYLAETGRARRRRDAVFSVTGGATSTSIALEPHQPHFQSLAYNALQGDLERWFEPVEEAVRDGASLRTILDFLRAFFDRLAPSAARWKIEVHQFRIEATAGAAGEPTPEGSHRDGVDYVCVLLVHRENIASGTTTIHTPGGTPLGAFTLTHALDAALIHDPRVFHGVTPVSPRDATQPAYRDVLVVTFAAR